MRGSGDFLASTLRSFGSFVYLLVRYWTHKAQFAFPSRCRPSTKAFHNPAIIEKISCFYIWSRVGEMKGKAFQKAMPRPSARDDNNILLSHSSKQISLSSTLFPRFFFQLQNLLFCTRDKHTKSRRRRLAKVGTMKIIFPSHPSPASHSWRFPSVAFFCNHFSGSLNEYANVKI